MNEMLQLEDLVANYPSSDLPGIQTTIAAKREFSEVGALPVEPPPIPGKTFYNNQRLLLRYMIPNDRLLVNWQTGTGKTCGFTLLAEYYHDLYLKDPENAPIRKTIILTPGPGLQDDIRLQIACRCTQGQYLNSNILEAKKLRDQKGNLKRSIGRWYTIDTYKKFILPLAKLSDDEIRRRYSRVIIVIDEAHNLNIDETEGERGKKVLYDQLWRFLHLTEGSKIILATATTMINEAREIAPLMNLLLPVDHQMPENWNYDTVTLDQVEPYFRGKVSFVRALDTGIEVILEGQEYMVDVETPEGHIEATLVATTSIMGDIQAKTYLTTRVKQGGIYGNQRQAANFVFPDGSWGGTFPRSVKAPKLKEGERMETEAELVQRAAQSGLGKYVVSVSRDSYRPTKEFLPWLRILDNPGPNDQHLGRLSCKYETCIRDVLAGTRGTVFVYNDFVFGSGAIVHILAFEANGFTRYKGEEDTFEDIGGATLPNPCSSQLGARRIVLPKQLRCAIITSDTNPATKSKILDLFSSPENVHGEYLKVLIGSEITREGLNLSHGTQVHLVTTWWNRSSNYQAISRVLRATSHILLLNEEKDRLRNEKNRLIQEGRLIEADRINPDEAKIPVQIFQHAALPRIDDYDESIDIYMYQLTNRKDYTIRRMERMLKQTAIDCWVHYDRNVRPTDEDYSPTCDYAPCQYQCFDPKPNYTDTETYDVYYIDETLSQAADIIANLFSANFSLSRDEIYTLLEEYNFRPVEVDRSLAKIMSDKRIIYDRYGLLSYLREDGDRFFLQRDFPLSASSSGSQSLEIYTSSLIATREISIPAYLSLIDADNQNEIGAHLLDLPVDSDQFDQQIEQLNPEGRITLLENSILQYTDGVDIPILSRIVEYFSNVLYILVEPIEDIATVEDLLAHRGKGKGPKEGRRLKIIKMTPDQLQDPIEDLTFEQARELVQNRTREIVFIHSLYNTLENRVAYNVSTRFKKGDGHLRILKPNEGVGWRDTKISEIPVYSAIIEEIRIRRTAPFERFDIYGTLLQDGMFRIRDKTTEQTRQQQGTERNDGRYGKRGRKCGTFDKVELITFLWKLGVEPPQLKRKISTDPDELIDYLIRKDIITGKDNLDEWDMDRLDYYTRWESFGTKDRLCEVIQQWFIENDRLLTF